MTEEEKFMRGYNAHAELQWAFRNLNPNTTFTKVMGVVFSLVTGFMVWGLLEGWPHTWPMIFFILLFGGAAMLTPLVLRDERRKQAEAKAVVEKYRALTESLFKRT